VGDPAAARDALAHTNPNRSADPVHTRRGGATKLGALLFSDALGSARMASPRDLERYASGITVPFGSEIAA